MIDKDFNVSMSDSMVVADNHKVALSLFKQAAASGLPEAITHLGHIYETGGYEDEKIGHFYTLVNKNMDRAQSLYVRAAALGDEGGLNYLGAFYFSQGGTAP